MFSLICAWTNGWANNREAGDLKRHRAHYNVIVMSMILGDVLAWQHITVTSYKHHDVSNHWRLLCLLNRLFRRASKKTSKYRLTGPLLAITWTNVDPDVCRHMASQDHNELNLCKPCYTAHQVFMMTSSNGNVVRVTVLLWGESTSHRWFPLQRISDAENASLPNY